MPAGLAAGDYTIRASATDVAGNTTTITRVIHIVPPVPAWSSATVYTGGEHVVYGGAEFVAQWWTQNQKPGDPVGPWAEIGKPVVTPAGTFPAWTASAIYTGGETVAYGGSAWKAKWWTRNQAPSTADSGPWAKVTPAP